MDKALAAESLNLIREAANRKLLFLPHAVRQMARPERMITTDEVRSVIGSGDVVENYPNDPRGRSCLILGAGDGGRPVHVVCSPKDEFLAVITTYVPTRAAWSADFRTRLKK